MKSALSFIQQNPAVLRHYQQIYDRQKYDMELRKQLFPALELGDAVQFDGKKSIIENIQDNMQVMNEDQKGAEVQLVTEQDVERFDQCVQRFANTLDRLNRSTVLTQQIINLKNLDYVDEGIFTQLERLATALSKIAEVTEVLRCQNSIRILLDKMDVKPIQSILK